MTRNAAAFDRDYSFDSIGDLVCSRHDSLKGGTVWSPTSRVIGYEGHQGSKGVWLLCRNVLAKNNIRPAAASEALAIGVQEGNPIRWSDDVIGEPQQQSFCMDFPSRPDADTV